MKKLLLATILFVILLATPTLAFEVGDYVETTPEHFKATGNYFRGTVVRKEKIPYEIYRFYPPGKVTEILFVESGDCKMGINSWWLQDIKEAVSLPPTKDESLQKCQLKSNSELQRSPLEVGDLVRVIDNSGVVRENKFGKTTNSGGLAGHGPYVVIEVDCDLPSRTSDVWKKKNNTKIKYGKSIYYIRDEYLVDYKMPQCCCQCRRQCNYCGWFSF